MSYIHIFFLFSIALLHSLSLDAMFSTVKKGPLNKNISLSAIVVRNISFVHSSKYPGQLIPRSPDYTVSELEGSVRIIQSENSFANHVIKISHLSDEDKALAASPLGSVAMYDLHTILRLSKKE